MSAIKVVCQITYLNGKAYVGQDLADSANDFGSAASTLLAKDFARDQRRDFAAQRELLWESESAADKEVSQEDVEFILALCFNDSAVGYSQWPRYGPQ